MSYLRLENISKSYTRGGECVDAVRNISVSFGKGDFVAITGESGSGKSTLMNILGLIDTADSGRYYLNGQDISSLNDKKLSAIRNEEIGFVFQSFNLIEGLTALENVELPLIYRGIDEKTRRRLSKTALESVGLYKRIGHTPSQMSGGQQQRVAVARAIAASPSIVLADEPTGNLDPVSSREIMRLLRELNERGSTVIIITHDNSIAESAGRVIRISDGQIE